MPIKRENYPADWRKISKRIRFERAGNRCEWCGVQNRTTNPRTGSHVVLTVAHLDQNTWNNDDSNLMALCQRCHLNHDRGHNIRKRVYGPASVEPQLFKS